MPDINLTQRFLLSIMDQQTGMSVPQLLVHVLEVQMVRNHPNGMDKTAARLWARIDDKLWTALEGAGENGQPCAVALDASELDYLAKQLDGAQGIPPQNARAVRLWQDLVDVAKKGG